MLFSLFTFIKDDYKYTVEFDKNKWIPTQFLFN